ncbi:Hydroxyproline-rich glycoprotein (HRGP) [Zea mays]|uniref:Hydroxyproline-rich glycoprotein (HRGP) n=2 Tax=Zea mays TaxID=4577 RepID=A0A1D6N4F4_MAIZE|nr:Hydroxyproline-rich glycoprotein (HRGP) [Zea mays]
MKMSTRGQPAEGHLWLVFTMLFVTSAVRSVGASSFAPPPSVSVSSPAYDPVIKVVGKVYCYRCFDEAHPDESHGKKHLQGAMVKVTCQADDQALVAFGYTRSNGKYSVVLKGLPISSSSSSNYGAADSCKVELHGAPGGSDCNVPIELNLSGLSVYSRSSEEVVFKANQIMAFASKNAFGCSSKPQTQSSSPVHPYYSSPPLIPHQYPSPPVPAATHRSPPPLPLPLPLPYQYSAPPPAAPAANQLPSPAYQYISPPPYQQQQSMLPNSYQTPPPPQGTESPVLQPRKYLPPPYYYYNSPPAPQHHQHSYVPPPPLAYQYPPPPLIHKSPLLPSSSPAAPYHYNSPPTYQYPPPPYSYQPSPPPAGLYSPPLLPPNAPEHLHPNVPHAKSPQPPLHTPPPPNGAVPSPSPTTPPLRYYTSPPPTDQLS